MKEIVKEFLFEWEEKLPEIKMQLNNYNLQIQILKEVGFKEEYVSLKKYFEFDDLNCKRNKVNDDILKLTEKQENLFKTKYSSLTALSLLKERKINKEDFLNEKPVQQEVPLNPFVKEEEVKPEIKPKNNIKNLLDNLKLKSKKKDENKENLMDCTIIIENEELKVFKGKEKKRLKEYLKENKIKKEDTKHNTPEIVYDVSTNKFINQNPVNNKSKVLMPWNKSPSIKDVLYKKAIDKERFRYKMEMNSYKPKMKLVDVSSDEEVENFSTGINLHEIVSNQNHDEIVKYFGCEQSIDIEMLFPNIKEISNDSPNKWI